MAAIHIHQQDFQRLMGENKPVLVEFWAPWCTYCRRIGAAYDLVAEQNIGTLTVAKVDIDQEPDLARQEKIDLIPTLVLYRGGKAVASLRVPESKAAIDRFLQEQLKGGQ